MNTTTTTPDTGRITLRLTTGTIRNLRLLAFLRSCNQNLIAEDLLLRGGLTATVATELLRDGGSQRRDPQVTTTNAIALEASPEPPEALLVDGDDPGPSSCLPPLEEPVRACGDDLPW